MIPVTTFRRNASSGKRHLRPRPGLVRCRHERDRKGM